VPATPYTGIATDWEQLNSEVPPKAAKAARDLEDNLAKSRDLATRLRNGGRTCHGRKAKAGAKLRSRRPGLTSKKKSPGPVPVPPATPE